MWAGGVPRRVRSDSLTAAVNNLSADHEFQPQYQQLLSHYGLEGHRINVRKPHENGDVELSHGHLKMWLDQSLLLRGHRNFESVEAYRRWSRAIVDKKSQVRRLDVNHCRKRRKPFDVLVEGLPVQWSRGDRTSIELLSGSFREWTKPLIAMAHALAS